MMTSSSRARSSSFWSRDVVVGGEPDPLEILTECQQGVALRVCQGGGALLFAAGQFGLGLIEFP
jgi:hypothetical protein